MRKISKVFKQKGFNFTQIKRIEDFAIYKKIPVNGTHTSYEVIIVSRHNGYELGGQKIEPAETYPSSSQWGTKGWTYTTLKDAETAFTALKEADKQKK
jgi:hypothetical protein